MSFIKLDREREVRLRNKEIALIERRFKKPFIETVKTGERLTVEEQVFILYAGLKHEDPSLTVEQVEELVDKHMNMAQLLSTITDSAFEAYGMDRGDVPTEDTDEDPSQAAE